VERVYHLCWNIMMEGGLTGVSEWAKNPHGSLIYYLRTIVLSSLKPMIEMPED
jgi:hypothetical protein